MIQWVRPNISIYLSSRQPQLWLLSLLVGLLVSVAAIVFRETIGLVQLVWLADRSESVASAARQVPWYVVLLTPALGGLLIGFALSLLESKRTGGAADVIEARAMGGRNLAFWPGVWSALVTASSLGFGASAGREGPIVHLGATISSSIGHSLRIPAWSQRTLLACGVAGAVSASFNAPIAGALFAHEVILGHYAMRSFVPIVISSVSGTILSRQWFGEAAAFAIPHLGVTSYWEFPAFVLLGLICAIVGIMFQFSLIGSDYVARNIEIPIWLRPAIGGIFIGALALYFPEILGVGYEATDLALHGELPLAVLISLLVAKTVATSITLASRFGGGIIAPSLYLGAMAGGAFGIVAASVFPDLASSQSIYSLIGMGAVAASVIGAPISTTVMMFELTGGYELAIALLLTVSISAGLNQAFHGRSFFQWQLEARGLLFQDGPHQYLVRNTRVIDFMTPLQADEKPPTYDPAEDPPALQQDDTLEHALRIFDQGGHARLAVVGEEDQSKICGWASQVVALRYFNKALIDASKEEHR